MPRSGGIYTLPPGYFAVDGTTIEVSQHNPPLEDIAEALTDSLPRDGSAPMTGNLPMGGSKITGLAAGTNASDAVRLDQVPNLTGLTATVTELNYTDGVTSPIQTQLDAKQGADATLTALAGLDGSTGLVAQTGTDTFTKRTITSSGGTVTVTNPGGVAGNINLEANSTIQWQTPITVTSGTSQDLSTVIPSTVTEIYVRFRGAQLTTGDNIRLRIGPSGGLVTSGYLGGANLSSSTLGWTSGFGLTLSNSTRVGAGLMRLLKTDTNIWTYTMVGWDTGGTNAMSGYGEVDAAGTVSQAQISVTGGAFTGTGTWQIGWR